MRTKKLFVKFDRLFFCCLCPNLVWFRAERGLRRRIRLVSRNIPPRRVGVRQLQPNTVGNLASRIAFQKNFAMFDYLTELVRPFRTPALAPSQLCHHQTSLTYP